MTSKDAAQSSPATVDAGACAALDAALTRMFPEADPVATARVALEALVYATGSSRGSILRMDPMTACLTLVAGSGIPDHLLGQLIRPRPRSIAYWVYRNQEGLLLQGRVKDARFEASEGADDIESSLCVSIMGSHSAVGVLSLARSPERPPFTDGDLHAISSLVDRLGGTLETLFMAELGTQCAQQIADLEGPRSLSRMAPGLTETHAWEFAVSKRPGLRLGADRCERVTLADGVQALMMADVPGFGAGAAALSGLVQGLFSGLALSERSARGMAGGIHAELAARAAAQAQVSMWIAFLSPRGDVRSCAAGGPAPLWVPADDSPVQRIGAGGPPLGGASDPEEYVEESFRLLPGDLLVAVSDGVLDMRDPTDAPFGARAVADLVAEHRRDALDRLIGCILGAVDEHGRQAQPADDQVVLAIRYTAGR